MSGRASTRCIASTRVAAIEFRCRATRGNSRILDNKALQPRVLAPIRRTDLVAGRGCEPATLKPYRRTAGFNHCGLRRGPVRGARFPPKRGSAVTCDSLLTATSGLGRAICPVRAERSRRSASADIGAADSDGSLRSIARPGLSSGRLSQSTQPPRNDDRHRGDIWALIGSSTFRRRDLRFDGGTDTVLAGLEIEGGVSIAIRDFRRRLLESRLGIGAIPLGSACSLPPAATASAIPAATRVRLSDGVDAVHAIREVLCADGLGGIVPLRNPGTSLPISPPTLPGRPPRLRRIWSRSCPKNLRAEPGQGRNALGVPSQMRCLGAQGRDATRTAPKCSRACRSRRARCRPSAPK